MILFPLWVDKYLWERIRSFLSRDDLLCLRETSKFHAECELFGPSWTIVLSPLVHVLRRPSWGRHSDVFMSAGWDAVAMEPNAYHKAEDFNDNDNANMYGHSDIFVVKVWTDIKSVDNHWI